MPRQTSSRTSKSDAAIQQRANSEAHEEGSKQGDQDDRQRIFDERFQLFTESFGKTCETEGVQNAIALVLDPKLESPIVFVKGDNYTAAKLLAALLRQMKSFIAQELDA